MRSILSISLPQEVTTNIKKIAKQRGFLSVSAYIKHLFEADQDLISETELLKDIKTARTEYARGKTTTASSLADLL